MAPIHIWILTIIGLSCHTPEAVQICETEIDLLLSDGTILQSSPSQRNNSPIDSTWNSTGWIPKSANINNNYIQALFSDVKNVDVVSVICDGGNNRNTVVTLAYSLDGVTFYLKAKNVNCTDSTSNSPLDLTIDNVAKYIRIMPGGKFGIRWRIHGCSLGFIDQRHPGVGHCQVIRGSQENIIFDNETQCFNITTGDLYVPNNSRNDHKCTLFSHEPALFNAEAWYLQGTITLTALTATETTILSPGDVANFFHVSLLEFRPIAGELRTHIRGSETSGWFIIYVVCSLWNGTDDSFAVSYGRPEATISPPSTEAKQKNINLAGISVVPILLSAGVIVAVCICIRRKKRKEDKEKALTPPAIGIDNKVYQRDTMTQETEDVYLEIPDPVSEPQKWGDPQTGEPNYSVNKKSVKNSLNTPQATAPTTEESQCNKEEQSHVYADKMGNSMGVSPRVDEGTSSNKGSAVDTSVYDLAKEVKQLQQPGNNNYLLMREDNADTNTSGTTLENRVMVDNDVYRQSVYGESCDPTISGSVSENVVMTDNDAHE